MNRLRILASSTQLLRRVILLLVVGTAVAAVCGARLGAAVPAGHALCCDTDPIGPTSCTNPDRDRSCAIDGNCSNPWPIGDHTCCSWRTVGEAGCEGAIAW
jgi:hypothetical protein